jgi:hypothetical protein
MAWRISQRRRQRKKWHLNGAQWGAWRGASANARAAQQKIMAKWQSMKAKIGGENIENHLKWRNNGGMSAMHGVIKRNNGGSIMAAENISGSVCNGENKRNINVSTGGGISQRKQTESQRNLFEMAK